ncbi:MAG: hypothetical protein ACHQ4J_12635, partial [Candidatus Binatia bacterium]
EEKTGQTIIAFAELDARNWRERRLSAVGLPHRNVLSGVVEDAARGRVSQEGEAGGDQSIARNCSSATMSALVM